MTGLAAAVLAVWASPLIAHPQLEPRGDAAIEARARDAVAREDLDQARELYLTLSGRFPDNDGYRIWAARLYRWSGDPEDAARLLEPVLERVPGHTEALVEMAYVRAAQRRYPDAWALLEQVPEEEAESVDVLMAGARLHTYQNEPARARLVVERVLGREPGNEEALELSRQLAARETEAPRMEIAVGYGQERFSFASPAHASSLTVSYTGTTTRAGVHLEAWDKLGSRSQRVGPLLTKRVGDRVWLRLSALWAREAAVLARQDYAGGASYTLPHGLVAGVDYRQLRFANPLVHVVSPSLEYYYPERPIWLRVTFYHSWSHYRTPTTPDSDNSSLSLQYNQQLGARVTARLGYARGNEDFSDLSVDRVGRFDANTYSAGAEIALSPSLTARISYSHQARSNQTAQNDFGIGLVIRR